MGTACGHQHTFNINYTVQAAEAALQQLNIYEPDPAIYTSVLSKVRRASLDCYLREVRQPVVSYQCVDYLCASACLHWFALVKLSHA